MNQTIRFWLPLIGIGFAEALAIAGQPGWAQSPPSGNTGYPSAFCDAYARDFAQRETRHRPVQGAATGAAAGAMIGGITGGWRGAGTGAAVGATLGAIDGAPGPGQGAATGSMIGGVQGGWRGASTGAAVGATLGAIDSSPQSAADFNRLYQLAYEDCRRGILRD